MTTLIENINSTLTKAGYETLLMPPFEERLHELLKVIIGEDKKERALVLNIHVVHTGIATEKDPQFQRVHFTVSLPFKCQEETLFEVEKIISYINFKIELTGFEIDHLTSEIRFRYIWLVDTSLFSNKLLKNIIVEVLLYLGLFADTIETVAKGDINFEEIIKKLVDAV